MARLNLPGGLAPTDIEINKKVLFIVNKRLSKEQKASGIYAKVQVRHPSVIFTLTVWENKGRKWVSEPSQKVSREGKDPTWFPTVALLKGVKDYVLSIIDNPKARNGIWYLDMLKEAATMPTAEASNPDLGIENIIIDGNLTDKQKGNNMVCKCNIVTDIGTLVGFTVWVSTFGDQLYGTAPSEVPAKNGEDDTRQRGAPGYRLTEKGLSQVLNYIHPMVDFTVKCELPAEATEDASAEQRAMEEQGFAPVGSEMFSETH